MSQESSSLTAWVVGRRCSPGPRNFSNVVLLMVQKPGKLTTWFGKFPIISWKILVKLGIFPKDPGWRWNNIWNQHLVFTRFFSSQVVVSRISEPSTVPLSLNLPSVTLLTWPDPWVASGAKVGTWSQLVGWSHFSPHRDPIWPKWNNISPTYPWLYGTLPEFAKHFGGPKTPVRSRGIQQA